MGKSLQEGLGEVRENASASVVFWCSFITSVYLVAASKYGIERGNGLLKNHRDFITSIFSHIVDRQFEQVNGSFFGVVIDDFATCNVARRVGYSAGPLTDRQLTDSQKLNSPTIPTVSPLASVKLTSSTAFTFTTFGVKVGFEVFNF